MLEFRKKLADHEDRQIFIDNEWNLKETTSNKYTDTLISKARWEFHCERCNVVHKRKRRINSIVVLNRTLRRMDVVIKQLKPQTEKTTEDQEEIQTQKKNSDETNNRS